MADFSCASTKRTSHWPAPMSREAPVRFRVSVVVAALVLTGCNANQEINPSSAAALPGLRRPTTWTTILTIPSATHRTTPGAALAVAVAVEAARPARRPKPSKEDRFPHATALAARQAAALQRARGAGEGHSAVILRLCSPSTGEP